MKEEIKMSVFIRVEVGINVPVLVHEVTARCRVTGDEKADIKFPNSSALVSSPRIDP